MYLQLSCVCVCVSVYNQLTHCICNLEHTFSVCEFPILNATFSYSSCTWAIRKHFDSTSSFLFSLPFTSDCFLQHSGILYACVCEFPIIWQLYRRLSQSWNGTIYRFAKWQKPLMNVSFSILSQSIDSGKASDYVYLNLDFDSHCQLPFRAMHLSQQGKHYRPARTHTLLRLTGFKRARANCRAQGCGCIGYLIEWCDLIRVNRRTQAYYASTLWENNDWLNKLNCINVKKCFMNWNMNCNCTIKVLYYLKSLNKSWIK